MEENETLHNSATCRRGDSPRYLSLLMKVTMMRWGSRQTHWGHVGNSHFINQIWTVLVSLYFSVTKVNTQVKNKKWHFFSFVKMYNHNEDSSIIETNHRNWQNDLIAFWLKIFSLQTKRNRTELGQGRQTKKHLISTFFLDISHRHYRFGLRGDSAGLSHLFFSL